MKKKILFLCTGNSCRSQMAEAIVNARLSEVWQAYSAGTHPSAEVHPLAVQVLREIGIEHSGVPKHLDQFLNECFDLVITVCDDAAEECPAWFGAGKRVHIGFSDPAKAEGSPEDVLNVFRQVRDQISQRILAYLEGRG